jgi:hypothetical protein
MTQQPMTPGAMKDNQARKNKETRAWKPKVPAAVKKFVAEQHAVMIYKRDQRRAAMVEAGQMKGGFPKD